jgi:hypothetical protein
MVRPALAGFALACLSCASSLDLDRFRAGEAALQVTSPTSLNYLDLRLRATSMQSHVNEYFELRIVDQANSIQAKAIYNDVVEPDFAITLERVIPKSNGPYRLDFWADHNTTGRYDGIKGGLNEKDHAWRRVLRDPLPEDVRRTEAGFEFDFIHNTDFSDIFTDLAGDPIPGDDTLLPCDLNVLGAGRFEGKKMDLRVVEKASQRLVGFYRQGRAREGFHALIPGILDEETVYEVSAFVDDNGSGAYEASDPSWKLEFTSGDNGASVDFDTIALPLMPIEVGAP